MKSNIIKANKILQKLLLLDIDIGNLYKDKLIKQNKFIKQEDLDLYDDVTFELKFVQSKFEVGKWYWNSDKSYAKCSAIRSSNSFYYKERINSNKCIKEEGSWGWHSEMRVATLEEIQPYLPEGHVDKIVKEEIPEYVECIKGAYFESIPQYKNKIIQGKIYKWSDLHDGTIASLNRMFSVWTVEFKPSTKEAYEAQFKTTTMKRSNLKKEDLKEGDKLKVISLEASDADWQGIGRIIPHFSLGDTVKVTEISDIYGGIRIGSSWYPPCMFEKVEEESKPMEEDLTGRYLKALSDAPEAGEVKKGEYGLVIKKNTGEYVVDFPSQNPYFVQIRNLSRYELMPKGWTPESGKAISKEPDKDELLRIAKEKYPIGCQVKCLQGWTNYSEETGIIKDKFEWADSDSIWTVGSKFNLCLYRKGQWAEIISLPKQEVKSKSMDEKWKVGGWIKSLRTGMFNGESYTEGKYYQILQDGNKLDKESNIYFFGDTNQRTALLKNTECEWVGMDKPYTDSDSLAKSLSIKSIPPPIPDKWCIERNSGNYERVNAWFKANCWTGEGNPPSVHRLFINKDNNRYGFDASYYPPSGYTAITQEQFDYWVLGNRYVLGIDSYKQPLTPDECYNPEIKNKPKGFNEEEYKSAPFNQVLVLPKKSKQIKKQLILT